MKTDHEKFSGIPWKIGGRDRAGGVDCIGLVKLFLAEEVRIHVPELPPSAYEKAGDTAEFQMWPMDVRALPRGTVLGFRKAGQLRHVAVALGNGKVLHATAGGVRIDNGIELLRRAGCDLAGMIDCRDSERLWRALANEQLGGPVAQFVIMLVLSLALSAASYLIRPKQPRFNNQTGRYGFSPLATQTSTTLPLPDLLGAGVLSGNAVMQSTQDKNNPGSDPATQKINRVVIWGSGNIARLSGWPSSDVIMLIGGNDYQANGFWTGFHGIGTGIQYTPNAFGAQTKAECVDGTFVTGPNTDLNVPTFSVYEGLNDITVPVDIRASYDREFPVYGFAGCAYTVLRFVDSSKFNDLNVQQKMQGRKCRTFNAYGFKTDTVTGASLAGADGTKVRFNLPAEDIQSVSLTVNGTAYAEIAASAQTGNVYQLNKTKGFVEFITAPAAAATILVSYTRFIRQFETNPAAHAVYLLTETLRGKGMDESKIDWASFDAYYTSCAASVTWVTSEGPVTSPKYTTNYAIDSRKPLKDHLQAILDAGRALLFLSEGKFKIKELKAESSVFSFNASNILVTNGKSTFRSELVDRSTRQNRIKVLFRSDDSQQTESEAIRDDVFDQRARAPRAGNNGVLDENLTLPAIDSKSQAERVGEMVLREETTIRWTVSFKTSIKGLSLEPGDVIDITQGSQPSWQAKVFRVEDLELDEDDHLKVTASEYSDAIYI